MPTPIDLESPRAKMFPEPEYHNNEEFQNRSRKLVRIRELGVCPYPAKWEPNARAETVISQHEGEPVGTSEEAAAGTTPQTRIAGRLVLFRAMGKNAFAQVQDDSARLQVMFNRDTTKVARHDPESETDAPTHLKFVEKLIDLGDIIGIEGNLFRTMKGELTLYAKEVTVLCKTLLPLPEKHSGIADKELRYRKRWLDLISHNDVRHTFGQRSRILKIVRDYLDERAFMEVETPVLQNIYGGAAAKPFTTHLNALDEELFLRISLEIALKKLVIGGINRVFEIGKVFRNEGIDRNHNPEFTLMEAYAAYWDYHDMMRLTEELCEKLALDLHGTTKVSFEGTELEFRAPWKRLTMKEAIGVYTDLDVDALDEDHMRRLLQDKGGLDPKKLDNASRGLLITYLFEELCEEHLIQPQHIIDHPIETTPLCKPHRNPKDRQAGLVERFESYVLGHELANAYSELNDPQVQRRLLLDQAERKAAGDDEANPLDEDFIEAICQGMPPAAGIGVGIDRLVMIFTGAHSIRDVLYFPMMRS